MEKEHLFYVPKRLSPTTKDYTLLYILARNKISDLELETFPLEHQFNAFVKEINELRAKHDMVRGIPREYVSAATLYPIYEKVFGTIALAPHSIGYRIRHIKHANSVDLIIFDDPFAKRREPKYFVNRLNLELLKKIYRPDFGEELKELTLRTAMFEVNIKNWEEDVEED